MVHEHDDILIALAGQPNSGKSTIFGMLTGMRQQVANFPGVTVEKKSGHYHEEKKRFEIVDLPGTYSLTSFSQEERVTRDFILLERPEVLIVVVDAANLRRHLFLIFQMLELQVPMILCLNMIDIAKRRGMEIDIEGLSRSLGIPVVPTVGSKRRGADDLRRAVRQLVGKEGHQPVDRAFQYPPAFEQILTSLENRLSKKVHLAMDFSPRWLAVKLLEGDREARRIVQHHTHDASWSELLGEVEDAARRYEKEHLETPQKAIASARFRRAEELERLHVRRVRKVSERWTDKIDVFTCHRVLGPIIMSLCLLLVFEVTFKISDGWKWLPIPAVGWATPVEALKIFFESWLPARLDQLLQLEPGALRSFLHDGVLAGIGGVLSYVPLIFVMFVLLAFLEDSGYIARVAIVSDRWMRRFGLQGQSILPMIIGGGIAGGCAIPGILATRTMRDPKERLLTMLVIPMMNCGAKIPVYGLLIGAFFTAYQGMVMVGLIILSWVMALFAAWLLSKTIVHGESLPLVLELPPWQMPTSRSILSSAGGRSWEYIKKAGTIILLINIILWSMMYFPRLPAEKSVEQSNPLEYSIAGRIGKAIEPVSRLAGFDWRDNVALLGGFAAKEVIVSSLSTAYSMEERQGEEGEESSRKIAGRLQKEPGWSQVKALALMIFVMLYAPCTGACVTIWRESGTWRWMIVVILFSTALAFIMAVSIYQLGTLWFG